MITIVGFNSDCWSSKCAAELKALPLLILQMTKQMLIFLANLSLIWKINAFGVISSAMLSLYLCIYCLHEDYEWPWAKCDIHLFFCLNVFCAYIACFLHVHKILTKTMLIYFAKMAPRKWWALCIQIWFCCSLTIFFVVLGLIISLNTSCKKKITMVCVFV